MNLLGHAGMRLHDDWTRTRDVGLLSLIKPQPAARVVDLGCGDGAFTMAIKEKLGCPSIEGVEVHPPFVLEAKKRGIVLTGCDLDAFPYPIEAGRYDVVVANQVIEHLVYPSRFIREVHRLLKPGGYAIISTENLASWDNVAALLLGFTPFSMQFDDGYWKVGNPLTPHGARLENSYAPHVRVFTLQGLQHLCTLLGFTVEVALGAGHLLGRPGAWGDRRHCRFITIRCRKSA